MSSFYTRNHKGNQKIAKIVQKCAKDATAEHNLSNQKLFDFQNQYAWSLLLTFTKEGLLSTDNFGTFNTSNL